VAAVKSGRAQADGDQEEEAKPAAKPRTRRKASA
jgi:hypothetical protein